MLAGLFADIGGANFGVFVTGAIGRAGIQVKSLKVMPEVLEETLEQA